VTPGCIKPKLGILAYGSLKDDPGPELGACIAVRIGGVESPFEVEFARRSRKRSGAPTLIPVESGGASVDSTILVLSDGVTEDDAASLLYQRESRSTDTYVPKEKPRPDDVIVKRLQDFHGVEVVLYASLGSNISDFSPEALAHLAIGSARGEAGARQNDGISYLMARIDEGVRTPLMPAYTQEILLRTGTGSLQEAWESCRRSPESHDGSGG
jgi:hypothetical protein